MYIYSMYRVPILKIVVSIVEKLDSLRFQNLDPFRVVLKNVLNNMKYLLSHTYTHDMHDILYDTYSFPSMSLQLYTLTVVFIDSHTYT